MCPNFAKIIGIIRLTYTFSLTTQSTCRAAIYITAVHLLLI